MSDEMKKKLSESELKGVAGGALYGASAPADEVKSTPVQMHYCIKCKKDTNHNVFSGGRMICSICGTSPTL